jgi:hypothetical protein
VAAEPALSQYRGVTLGDSVEMVVNRLQALGSSVKIVHERPALIQELTWRPRALVSGVTVTADSVGEIVLTFMDGALAQIGVHYDRERTQGMTDADLNEAVGRVYGSSLLPSTPTALPSATPAQRKVIGTWQDAETLLVLWREPYPSRVGLVITSIANLHTLPQALAEGVRLQTAAAPGLELARRAAAAAALQARDEKIRADNITKFKPN